MLGGYYCASPETMIQFLTPLVTPFIELFQTVIWPLLSLLVTIVWGIIATIYILLVPYFPKIGKAIMFVPRRIGMAFDDVFRLIVR